MKLMIIYIMNVLCWTYNLLSEINTSEQAYAGIIA